MLPLLFAPLLLILLFHAACYADAATRYAACLALLLPCHAAAAMMLLSLRLMPLPLFFADSASFDTLSSSLLIPPLLFAIRVFDMLLARYAAIFISIRYTLTLMIRRMS